MPFLESRRKEVVDIMTMLFDQQKVMEIELYNAMRDGREEGRAKGREEGRAEGLKEGRKEGREEGRKEGREEGRKEGRAEGQAEVLRKMLKKASILDVSELTGIPQDEIKRLTQQS